MDIEDLLSRLAVALGIGSYRARGWFVVDIAVFGAAAAVVGAVALWLALLLAPAA